jgi:lambda family phage tail tape measure protein
MASSQETVLRATLDSSGFKQGQLDINIAITSIQEQLDKTTQSTKNTEASFTNLGAAAEALAGIMGALIGSFSVDKLIEVNSTYNRLSVEMNTVTGSAQGAQIAIQNLIQFANTTPYTLDQVSQAFITLRNAGLDSSTAMLSSLSNVASSVGRPIGDITQAIASAAVGNTEMLRGFGVEAQQAGDKITVTFQGISQTIERSGPSIERYLAMLGNTTFEGDTARQAQTISGRMSTMQDSVENLLRAVGDGGFNDAFKGLITDLTNANNSAIGLATTIGHELGDAINGARYVWEQYGTQVNAVIVGLGSIVAAGTGLRTLSLVFGAMAGVIAPIPIAIGAAVTALTIYKDDTIMLGGQPTTVLQGMKDIWAGTADYIEKAYVGLKNYYNEAKNNPNSSEQKIVGALGRGWEDFSEFSDRADGEIFNLAHDPKEWSALRQRFANHGRRADGSVMSAQDMLFGDSHYSALDYLAQHGRQANAQAAAATPAPPVNQAPALPETLSGIMPGGQNDNMLKDGILSPDSQQYLKSHLDVYRAAVEAAQRNKIPLNYFLKLLDEESGGLSDAHASARSPTGAIGFGQVLPKVAARPGYNVAPFQGDLTNPIDNINFSADYLAHRARYEQNLRPDQQPDWIWAARSYGTDSLDGNLGNVHRMTAVNQSLLSALKMDGGNYSQAQDLSIRPDSQTTALINQDQMEVGKNTDYAPGYGARRALEDQLIRAGFVRNIDDNDLSRGVRPMTRDEVISNIHTQNWNEAKLGDFDQISRMAPAAYNAQIGHTQDVSQAAIQQTEASAAMVSVSKSMEIMAQAEKARQEALGRGESPDQARRAGDLAGQQEWANLRLQNAQQIQASTRNTQQSKAQNDAIANQPLFWDETSASYIFDTRQQNAQQIQHQLDPYGLNPTASHQAAQEQANSEWDRQRAQEAAQDRLSAVSQSDPLAGLSKGWKEFQDQFNNANGDMKKVFSDSMEGMTNSMVQFITTGRGGWKSLAESVVTDITTMSVHYLESAIFKYAANALGGFLGFPSTPSTPTRNAVGGVYDSGLSAYSGSIVSTPTYFNGTPGARYADGASLMGEAGPEAILPLKRGSDGKLGLASSGGGGGVTVHMGGMTINNPTTDQGGRLGNKQAENLNRQINDMVTMSVQRVLTNQQRPGGLLQGSR